MLPQEIIRKKRDKKQLTPEEIKEFISGVPTGKVTEGQIAAFCMAVFFNKMTMEERVALTTAMANSGSVLDWKKEDLGGPTLDKHSTGGIGDKVSLILAPVIAALGGFVPMISGRGLGHTGGTLDKMDSIKGYISQPDNILFKKAVKEAGCAIIGATEDLAPADRKIYAIRDVTATVESLDLITASILSKKMAAGLDALVMDVKFGTGAFMQEYEDAKALAESIVSVANGGGLKTRALLTDMNQVLGFSAGNALEVMEVVEFLTGKKQNNRLKEVTFALCAELLVMGELATDEEKAKQKIEEVVNNGKAAEYFAKMLNILGAPADFMEKSDSYLDKAQVIVDFYPEKQGYISKVDARAIGIGILELGGGRTRPQDSIDYSVGLSNIAEIGDKIDKDTKPLATIHAKSKDDIQKMRKTLENAISISDKKPEVARVVIDSISHNC